MCLSAELSPAMRDEDIIVTPKTSASLWSIGIRTHLPAKKNSVVASSEKVMTIFLDCDSIVHT